VNNEFQRMWEEAIFCIVSVERDDMTKDCGLLVNILGGGVCLKHLVGGRQLHIDYKPETATVEKVIHVIQLHMMVSCAHTYEDESILRTILCSLLLNMCPFHAFQYHH